MYDVVIVDRPGPLSSSLALSHDVLWTANSVARALGKPRPFGIRKIARPRDAGGTPAALIIPGQGHADEDAVNQDVASAVSAGWHDLVRDMASQGVLLVSSCSGVFLLGAAGQLDARDCTTSWFLAAVLSRRHPAARVNPDALVIEDGQVITGGAAMAQGEAMIALVARLAGFEVADLTARYLLLDNKRSQADYRLIAPMVAGDPMLAAAERWTRNHIHEPFSIGDLCDAIGTTPWTFARALQGRCAMTPVKFVNHIRREIAQSLLATGTKFDQAAYAVGYADSSALRRLLAPPRASAAKSHSGVRKTRNPPKPKGR